MLVVIWVASAQAYTTHELLLGMENMGIRVSRVEGKRVTTLTLHCDEHKVITEMIPGMQAAGLMDPDLTKMEISNQPIVHATGAAIIVASTVVRTAYEDAYQDSKTLDRLKVQANLEAPDDFGHLHEHPIFSFTFSRALYRKIDWKHFQIIKLPEIAPGFQFSPWFRSNAEIPPP